MVARIATFDSLPTDLDPAAVKRLREIVKGTPGYVAGYHLRDSESGEALSLVIVDEPAVGREIQNRLDQRPAQDRVGIDPDRVRFYEVEAF